MRILLSNLARNLLLLKLLLLVLGFFNNTHCRSEELNGENQSVVLDLVDWYNLLERGEGLISVALIYQTKRQINICLWVIVDMAD